MLRLLDAVLAVLLAATPAARAGVTIYSQIPLGQHATETASANAANYTGSAAYNPIVLVAPALPNPMPSTTFFVQLESSNATVQGISIPQAGTFFGFSIEMSVTNQVLGENSKFINVPFLNLMSNLEQRGGAVHIRVGGNTQETARLVPELEDGRILEKDKTNLQNPTGTPPLVYTPDLLYLMSNISSLVNVKWYLGVPLNDSQNLALDIMVYGQRILGDNVLMWQVGNEPDLYAGHGHRNESYGPYDYFGEFGNVVSAIGSNQDIPVKNMLMGPSLATGDWVPQQIWDTGFLDTYKDNLGAITFEHYPTDNCAAQFGTGTPRNAQDVLPNFLNHTAGKSIISLYVDSTFKAQQYGKPLYMFETNTASCGGFPGISNSFTSALWGVDYGLQMAYTNFSGAMVHVGGQNVFYNPFTAPPTNQSTFNQWTVGPIYYASLFIAEAFGKSNASQIFDVKANGDNIFTPGYVIYENGAPARLAFVNFMNDPTGASGYNVSFAIGGSGNQQPEGTPKEVKVKYLIAPTVTSKDNITWAGQTFGSNFQSDGRPIGDVHVETVTCNDDNTCTVHIPAPGAALVFLKADDPALTAGGSGDAAARTFATTAQTRTHNTATVDPSVLATSNGHSGAQRKALGSTSHGKNGAADGLPSRSMLVAASVLVLTLSARLMM